MLPFLVFFLSFFSFVFSSLENDASIAIHNSINPISGDFIISEVDLIARGYEPIYLERTYISSAQEGEEASWIFMPHLFIYFEPNREPKKKPSQIYATEPHGTKIHYQNSLACKTTYLPFFDNTTQGLTNSSKNEISAKTNLRNYKILKLPEESSYILITPDGTERFYKKVNQMYFAYLEKERKPNGNWIIYSYNEDFYTLKEIRSTNPSQSVNYASINLRYQHRDPSIGRNFQAITSLGETASYEYEAVDKNKERFFKLKKITSSCKESESLTYNLLEKRPYQLITERQLGEKTLCKVNYYHPGLNQVGQDPVTILDKFDPIEKRIKTLQEPVGNNGELLTTHRFFYNLGQHPKEKKRIDFSKLKQPLSYVVDYDIFNKKTVYYFNEFHVPEFTHQFGSLFNGSEETVLYGEHFFWRKQDFLNLLETKIVKTHEKVHSKKHYSYDSDGNILQELVIANLTGQGSGSIALDNSIEEKQADHHLTSYAYDTTPFHNLLRKTTEDGVSVCLEYLPSSNLKTAEFTLDQGHIELRKFYTYNQDNILIEIIEDDGSSKDKNNLAAMTYRKVTTFQLSKEKNAYNQPQIIEEKGWNPIKKTLELLSKKVLTYNTKGLVAQETLYDAKGTLFDTKSYEYDEKNRHINSKDAKGRLSMRGYDSSSHVNFEKACDQTATTHYTNDIFGNPLAITTQYPSLNQETALFTYDLKKRLISHKDTSNNVTDYLYDDFNQPIQTTLPARLDKNLKSYRPVVITKKDCFGNITETTDALGYTTKTTYNFYNQPVCISYPDNSQDLFVYSNSGRLLKETLRTGLQSHYIYDYLGRVIKKETFSPQGAKLSSNSYTYKGLLLLKEIDHYNTTTSYRYDAFCRKVEENVSRDNTLLSSKSFSYDLLGRVVESKEINVIEKDSYRILQTCYNTAGKISEEKETDGIVTFVSKKYTYDAFDRVISIAYQNPDEESCEAFSYDEKNRLLSYKDKNGIIIKKSYRDCVLNSLTNCFDTEITTHFPNSTKKIEILDNLGYLRSSKTFNDHNQILLACEYSYDAKGNLTQQIQEDFEDSRLVSRCVLDKTYDYFGNILAITEKFTEDPPKNFSYQYDQQGHLISLAQPDGTKVTYAYDDFSRLLSIKSSDNTIFYTFSYNQYDQCIEEIDHILKTKSQKSYNALGLIEHETLGNGLKLTTYYEGFARPSQLHLPDQSIISYSYDSYHVKKIERATAQKKTYFHDITQYDTNHCYLEENTCIPGFTLTHRFDPKRKKIATSSPLHSHIAQEFFPDGSLKKAMYTQKNELLQEYNYDSLGHLTEEIGVKQQNYKFDAFDCLIEKNNQLLQRSSSFYLQQDAKATYEYSLNGNRILKKQQGRELSYTYDALNRLTKLTSETIQIHFTYDAQNRRLSKKVFSKNFFGSWSVAYENNYVYFDELELGSFEKKGNLQQLKIPSNLLDIDATAISIELGKSIYLPLYDLFGNITELVDITTQKITESYKYTAFGETLYFDNYGYQVKESYLGNPWQYQSKRVDEESGLIFFGMRYYDSYTTCWISPDPLMDLDGMNPYHYVHGNPVDYKDLLGLNTTSSEQEPSAKNNPLYPFTPNNNPYSQAPWVYTPPGYQYQPSNSDLLKKPFYSPYGSYNIHPDKGFSTSDNYRFFFINGINTSLREAKAMQNSCSKALSYNVDLFYNSTHGTLYDLNKVAKLHERKHVDLVTELKHCLIHEITYGKEVVVFAHSAGGAILNNTYELLPEAYQKKVHMISFGSAKFFPQKHDSQIMNYVSSRDAISIMSNLWNYASSYHHPFAKKTLQHKLCVSYLKPNSYSILKEHSFLGKTYQDALRSSCYNLKEKFELP